MGQNKEDLKKLLAFISALTEQPGNEEFVAGLRALVGQPNEPGLKADLEDIRRILRIRGIQSIDYSFVNDELTRNQLIMDNIRMEDCLLDNELSVQEKYYEFCSYIHFQVENVLNYYYTKAFSTFDLAQWHIETYSKGAPNPFAKNSKLVSCTEISTYHKTTAFCADFFPWVQGAPDYTSSILSKIRNVRNEYVHRSGVTVKIEGEKVKELQKNYTFASLRTVLQKLVDCARQQFDTSSITTTVEAVVEECSSTGATINSKGKVTRLDDITFSKYSPILYKGRGLSIIVKNNILLDIII